MSTVLIINPPAPFINANQKLHWAVKARHVKAWRLAARLAVDTGWHPVHYKRAHIVIEYRFPNNQRREVSNLQGTSKALVDGLVDARLLPDDADQFVVGPDNRREYPNGPARVTITITEEPPA